MTMSVSLIVPPAEEPITLEEAKRHARVTTDSEDDLVAGYIVAARSALENYLNIKFLDQTLMMTVDAFFGERVRLPYGPVTDIESIDYLSTEGVWLNWGVENYYTNFTPEHWDVYRRASWPRTYRGAGSVRVTYRSGYADRIELAEQAPSLIQAMRIMTAFLYRNRDEGGKIPEVVKLLAEPYRRSPV